MELHINALQTEVGVSMGDHGQDVVKAIIVAPEMTVRELCEVYLTKRDAWFPSKGTEPLILPDANKFVTIRLADPRVGG